MATESESNITPIHAGVRQDQRQAAADAGLKFHANKARRDVYTSREAMVAQACREDWPFGELSTDMIARLTGANVTTARRWKRTRQLPHAVRILGHVLVHGDLGAIDSTWDGWWLHHGKLSGPGVRNPLNTSALQHFAVSMQRVAALEATIRRHETTIATLRAQRREAPTPEQRRERADAFKAIGRAELLMRLTIAAEAMFDDDTQPLPATILEKAHEASRTAAGLLTGLYERTDPETGRPYYKYTSDI